MLLLSALERRRVDLSNARIFGSSVKWAARGEFTPLPPGAKPDFPTVAGPQYAAVRHQLVPSPPAALTRARRERVAAVRAVDGDLQAWVLHVGVLEWAARHFWAGNGGSWVLLPAAWHCTVHPATPCTLLRWPHLGDALPHRLLVLDVLQPLPLHTLDAPPHRRRPAGLAMDAGVAGGPAGGGGVGGRGGARGALRAAPAVGTGPSSGRGGAGLLQRPAGARLACQVPGQQADAPGGSRVHGVDRCNGEGGNNARRCPIILAKAKHGRSREGTAQLPSHPTRSVLQLSLQAPGPNMLATGRPWCLPTRPNNTTTHPATSRWGPQRAGSRRAGAAFASAQEQGPGDVQGPEEVSTSAGASSSSSSSGATPPAPRPLRRDRPAGPDDSPLKDQNLELLRGLLTERCATGQCVPGCIDSRLGPRAHSAPRPPAAFLLVRRWLVRTHCCFCHSPLTGLASGRCFALRPLSTLGGRPGFAATCATSLGALGEPYPSFYQSIEPALLPFPTPHHTHPPSQMHTPTPTPPPSSAWRCRAAKTLIYYLMETNLTLHSWMFAYLKANPIPRVGPAVGRPQ